MEIDGSITTIGRIDRTSWVLATCGRCQALVGQRQVVLLEQVGLMAITAELSQSEGAEMAEKSAFVAVHSVVHDCSGLDPG